MSKSVWRGLAAALGLFLLSASAPGQVPFGAEPIDASAYMLGTFRFNIIFLESNGGIDANVENWTAAQLANVRSEVEEVAAFWEAETAAYHPNARFEVEINYPNGGTPIATGYEPITRTSSQDSLWINQAMGALGYTNSSHFTNVQDFNHDQRVAGGTNWSSTAFIVNDEVDADNRFSNSMFAYAHIGGPYTVFTYGNNGWGIDRFNRVMTHELAHSFFGLDEYSAVGARTSERSGYLNGVNGNAELGPSGEPVTPPQPNALMLNNTLDTSPFTDVHVGHRDTDGDSIPDILDTFDVIVGNSGGSNPATGDFVFAGSATVSSLPNRNTRNVGFSTSGNDMTINWVTDAQYRLDTGDWTSFAAMDGIYDSYVEPLAFTLPGLPFGAHLIEVRELNSVDNPSNVLAFNFESLNPVPEPSTWLVASAAMAILWARRRQA